jgi:hypothetical protein
LTRNFGSAGDTEVTVPANLFWEDLDPVHAGIVRSHPAPRRQRVHIVVDPLEGGLNPPVREVADEAGEPTPSGQRRARRAEEDSLDSPHDHHANPLHCGILTFLVAAAAALRVARKLDERSN